MRESTKARAIENRPFQNLSETPWKRVVKTINYKIQLTILNIQKFNKS